VIAGIDVLEIRDLTIEYASGGYVVRPISNLSLRSETGRLVLLLGASGCGKTTLLSVVAGLLTPASGSVRVAGTEVVGLSGHALTEYRRHTVGVVFQAFNLLPALSASENVEVPLRAAGWSKAKARGRAEELLGLVDLSERMHHRPGDLSGGQQQRVAIARGLAHDPPVLLADEPTAHLDYLQVEGVIRLLRSLADSGRLVVVATHDDRLVPLADAIVNLTPRADTAERPPTRCDLAAGEVLFREGDHGDLVYVIEDGEIDLFRERADGTEELIQRANAGAYFGELAPMLGLPRAATARAVGPAVLTGYTLRTFRAQMGGSTPGSLLEQAADAHDAAEL
jgi:putative ABC transport system ATP-binding protein